MSALSGEKGDKSKYSSCNKLHSGKCNNVKNTAALSEGVKKFYSVCDKYVCNYKTKTSVESLSKCVKDFQEFNCATNEQKQALVKKIKGKTSNILKILQLFLQDQSL